MNGRCGKAPGAEHLKAAKDGGCVKEVTNCRGRIQGILEAQRETRNLLVEVVGPPVIQSPDEEEPVGALADVECGLRSVERHAMLLFDMVSDLHDRI